VELNPNPLTKVSGLSLVDEKNVVGRGDSTIGGVSQVSDRDQLWVK